MKKSKNYFCHIEMIQKQKTPFFVDVKTPIMAGMEMMNGETVNYKIRKIGCEVSRIYFDTAEKDCTIGIEIIKRMIR